VPDSRPTQEHSACGRSFPEESRFGHLPCGSGFIFPSPYNGRFHAVVFRARQSCFRLTLHPHQVQRMTPAGSQQRSFLVLCCGRRREPLAHVPECSH
ncbi:hypothetical protein FKM82_018833, partial [Ascaphus truei]